MAIAAKSSEYTRIHAKSSHTNGAPPKKHRFFRARTDINEIFLTLTIRWIGRELQKHNNKNEIYHNLTFSLYDAEAIRKPLADLNALFSMETYIHMHSLSKLPFLKITISPVSIPGSNNIYRNIK